MRHLDEGTLVTLRDGELGPTGAEEHLDSCGECMDAMREARRTAELVTEALDAVQEPFDLERAREAVRERVRLASAEAAGSPPLRPRVPWGAWTLARAAGLVLIAAVGAYALPGSPVRGWVAHVFEDGGTPEVQPAAVEALGVSEEAGIRVSVTPPTTVRISGLAPGDAVEVAWVPGMEVAVFAPSGSRFGSDADGVTAVVAGGPVRMELPREVRPLTLAVDNGVWLRNLGEGIQFLVQPEDPSAEVLRFVVPGAPQP